MAAEGAWPPSLRPIGKYLARASEIEATEPLVAYYCTLYSLKTAIKIRDKSDPNASKLVTSLLEKCEAEKAKIGAEDEQHKELVQNYAIKVFRKADDEDRAGEATLETAKTFYSAMCFLEICRNFGPLEPAMEEKLKYAKWKVATITKAIREGRRPEPGPPGGIENKSTEDMEGSATHSNVGEQQPYLNGSSVKQDHTSSDISTPSDQVDERIMKSPRTNMQNPYPSASVDQGHDDLQQLGGGGNVRYPPTPPAYPSQDEPSPLNTHTSPYGTTTSSTTKHVSPRNEYSQPSAPEISAPPPPTTQPLYPSADNQRYDSAPERPFASKLFPLPSHPTQMKEESSTPMRSSFTSSETRSQTADPNYEPTASQISKAQQMAKNAVSALDFQDLKTAVGQLEQALTLLSGQKH